MNLSRRVESLESKARPGKGVTVIKMQQSETNEQAEKRYCAENAITTKELSSQSEITVFLKTDFDDSP